MSLLLLGVISLGLGIVAVNSYSSPSTHGSRTLVVKGSEQIIGGQLKEASKAVPGVVFKAGHKGLDLATTQDMIEAGRSLFKVSDSPPVLKAGINTLTSSQQALDVFLGGSGDAVLYAGSEFCHHCRDTKPKILNISGGVPIAMVDSSHIHEILAHTFFPGIPIIVKIQGGKMFNYLGNRSQESLQAFAQPGI